MEEGGFCPILICLYLYFHMCIQDLYQIKILSEDYDSRGRAKGLTEGDKQQNLEGLEQQQARLQQQRRETNQRWKAMEIEEQRQARREQAYVNMNAGYRLEQ